MSTAIPNKSGIRNQIQLTVDYARMPRFFLSQGFMQEWMHHMDVTVCLILFTDMLMHNVQCLTTRTNNTSNRVPNNRHETHQHIHNRQFDHTFSLYCGTPTSLFKGIPVLNKTAISPAKWYSMQHRPPVW